MTGHLRLRALLLGGALGVAAAVPHAATAGVLAPTRASDVVSVQTDGITPCVGNFAGMLLNTYATADGALTPGFTIPDGKVFVITDGNFQTFAAPGDQITFSVVRVSSDATTSSRVVAVGGVIESNGQQQARNATALANFHAVIVKPGTSLCVACDNQTTLADPGGLCFAQLHGFFAKDK
jgi:hypothetical protein